MKKEDFIPGEQYIMMEAGGSPKISEGSIVTFLRDHHMRMGVFSCEQYKELDINYSRLEPYTPDHNVQLHPLIT